MNEEGTIFNGDYKKGNMHGFIEEVWMDGTYYKGEYYKG